MLSTCPLPRRVLRGGGRLATVPAVLLVLALAACSSATPQKRAHQSLDTIATTVDVAMKTAAGLYAEGRAWDESARVWRVVAPSRVLVTQETWDKLAGIHEKYRVAGKAAAIAIRAAGPHLRDPEAFLLDVQAAASEVMALVTLLKMGRLE